MQDWFAKEFDKAITEIDMNSTPGKCILGKLGATNKEVFKWDGVNMDKDRVHYVRSVVYDRYVRLGEGQEVADPIYVFVKPEPHTKAKIEQGRYRLISAVSLVDTLVDRILLGWLQRVCLATVGQTPCLVGWTPTGGGWRELQRLFRGQPVLCLDKSSFDWTVQQWLVELWLEFILALPVGKPPWFDRVVTLRFRMLFELAEFEFQDGVRAKQNGVGIMKSGCYLTLLLNAVGQSILHNLASVRCGTNNPQPCCVGDDTVQVSPRDLEAYVAAMLTTGAKVKGAKIRSWIEFVGFAINDKTCWPAYWKKHLYKLQFAPNLEQTLHDYQGLYVNEPVMFNFMTTLANEIGPTLVRQRLDCLSWMNGT